MKASELRSKNAEDLGKLLKERREELMNLRFQSATGALENSSRLAAVKRDIARILTVLNETQAAAPAGS